MKFMFMVGGVWLCLLIVKVYAYRRFFAPSPLFSKHKASVKVALVAISIGELGLFALVDMNLSYTQYFFLGLGAVLSCCLFAACLFGEVARFTARLVDSKRVGDEVLDSRRRFFRILADLGVLILFFFFSVRGVSAAVSIPPVKELKLRIPKLKESKNIALISDAHLGRALGGEFLRGIVEKINSLEVDVVVIVGDLVDDKIDKLKDELLVLKDLKTKEGVFYVVGNHEYYHGIDSIIKFLKTLGLKVLHNKNAELDGFNLAGVADLAGLRFNKFEPDIEAAKKGLNPNKPSILLAHQPKFVSLYDVSDFDLVLSGHTHAGQVFPMSFFVWLSQRYVHGLYDLPKASSEAKDTRIYVSSGVGFWGPALRFLAPSEIVHIRLEPEQA